MLPNFLLIGAEKSGTTSVYNYLREHPQIFMSRVKEPLFFAFEGRKLTFKGPGDEGLNRRVVTALDRYEALFSDAGGYRAVGEASASYLYHSESAERAAHYIPQAKLIVILRCPADRAFSNFQHAVREQREQLDFGSALLAEPRRIAAEWSPFFYYKSKGWYYEQLTNWMKQFPRSQFLFLLYDDLVARPSDVMRSIFEFLEVDPDFRPEISIKRNVSGKPISVWLHKLIKRDSPVHAVARALLPTRARGRLKAEVTRLNLSRSSIGFSLRRQLMTEYAVDLGKLEDLLGRNLSVWSGPASR